MLMEKLAAHNAMTELKCITSVIVLLHDVARMTCDFRDMFHHLRSVAEDALTTPWTSVRSWSQKVFDQVEGKRLIWSDRQGMQNYHH